MKDDPVTEYIIEAEIENLLAVPYGYVFRKPIPADLTRPPSVKGMSLDEIENRFGRKKALLVYWLAAHGRDPTKPHPIEDEFPAKNCVRLSLTVKRTSFGPVNYYLKLLPYRSNLPEITLLQREDCTETPEKLAIEWILEPIVDRLSLTNVKIQEAIDSEK